MDCSANALSLAVASLGGLEDGDIASIITYLLCQWANK